MSRRLFEDTPVVQPSTTSTLLQQPVFQAPVPVAPSSSVAARKVAPPTDADIDALVQGRVQQNSEVVSRMLAITKASAADEIAGSLNEAIAIAKGLDPEKLAKGGILRRFMGIGATVKEAFEAKFQSFEERLNVLVTENGKYARQQEQRVKDIRVLYEDNRKLCEGYEEDQVRAKALLDALKVYLAGLDGSKDVFAAQDKHRVDAQITRVEQHMYDTQSLIQKSHQRAPKLDDMEQNAEQLKRSMKLIETTLIPNLRSEYTDFLLGLEQKTAAQVANSIYDLNDETAIRSAEMQQRNVEDVAKLSERPVISIDTLKTTQRLYLEGAQKALEIHEKGRQARIEGLKALKELDDQLIAHANKTNH